MPRDDGPAVGTGAGCRFCGMPWRQTVRILTGNNVNAELRVCTAHACAVQLGDWALTVRSADMSRTLHGADLDWALDCECAR